MAELMRILIVEPGKAPRPATIEHTLENLQDIVGGTIQAIYPWDDRLVGLVCNDDGIILGLDFNRFVEEGKYGPIWGRFFLCGLGEDDFQSLTEDDEKFLMERFRRPEFLMRAKDGQTVVFRGI